jgi:hypothetical protein
MRYLWGLAALAIGLAASAHAQDAPRTAEFSIGAVRVQVDLPEGYCVADKQLFDATQGHVDSGMNTTHLLIVKCGAHTLEDDFYAIKTPTTMLDQAISRDQLFAQLKPVYGTPELAAQMAAMNERASAITEARGSRVDFKGALKPIGMDETCAYLGGLVTAQRGSTSVDIAQGDCLTAIGDRVVTVYSTGQGTSPADLQRHIRASKALVLGMRPVAAKK